MTAALSSPVLIGRDDLLAHAERRLAAPAGELLLLAGEAGIGKTRLLAEITRRARRAGFTVVAAGAAPGDHEVAGGVLADLGTELRRDPATADAGERLGRRLREITDDEPQRRRRLLVADLAELIAGPRPDPVPTLIAVEDLHWADDLTLDVLARLGRRAAETRLLLVGTYRSDELYPRVPLRAWRTRLLTQRLAEEVRLPRLGPAETAAMAAAIAGTGLPTAVTAAVHARSDGIPLHVEEFLAAGDRVPETLAEAVLVRAEQLSPAARELAEAASVLGRSFDVGLLTALTGEPVDAGLRELTERFFVRPDESRETYDFRHALIRDALYVGVPPHRRRRLHARAAAAATGFPEAFLSDQYERAGRPDQAFGHARRAAAEAAAISAHREAAELYRRARRTWPTGLPDAERAGLLRALAAELAAVDDNDDAAACYAEAHRLRLAAGDRAGAAAVVPDWVAVRHLLGANLTERTGALRAALALVPDRPAARAEIHAALAAAYMLERRLPEALASGETARSLPVEDRTRCHLDATVGSVLLFAGRLAEGTSLLRGAIDRATAARLEAPAARAYRMLGTSMSVLVEYPTAADVLTEGIAYADRVEQFNDAHYMTAHLAHVRWATGDWAAAGSLARRALADGGGITTRITALHVLGYVALGRGALDEAAADLTEAASLAAGMGELQRLSPAWWGLAELALARGDLEAATGWCERGLAASAPVRDAAYLFPFVVTGVRAWLARHDATAARRWLRRTSELLRERDIPGTAGALHHAEGLLHLHEGRTQKARAELAAAADFWAARDRFFEGTAARLDQARCATRARRPAEAATFLAMARLIAGGLTNREIAAALTIAPKTAAAHVEHIRTKLGVSRRAQIAVWVTSAQVDDGPVIALPRSGYVKRAIARDLSSSTQSEHDPAR